MHTRKKRLNSKSKNFSPTIISAILLLIGTLLGVFVSIFIVPKTDIIKFEYADIKDKKDMINEYWGYVINHDFDSKEYKNTIAKLQLMLDKVTFYKVESLATAMNYYKNIIENYDNLVIEYNECENIFFPSTGIALALYMNTSNSVEKLKLSKDPERREEYIKFVHESEINAHLFDQATDYLISGNYYKKPQLSKCEQTDYFMPGGEFEDVPLSNEELLDPLKNLNMDLYNDVLKGKIVSLPVKDFFSIAQTLRYEQVTVIKEYLINHFQKNIILKF